MNQNYFKTKLCRFFEENGSCKFENDCRYAHGNQELNTQAPNNGGNYHNDNNRQFNNNRNYNNNNNGGYNNGGYNNRRNNEEGGFNNSNMEKTKLCNFFQNGSCKYENNCRYAHGEKELKNLN